MKHYDQPTYGIRDGCRAVVTGNCKKGIFLWLENDQQAFASFSGLDPGTEVLCTILKKATPEKHMLVTIDSVLRNEHVA